MSGHREVQTILRQPIALIALLASASAVVVAAWLDPEVELFSWFLLLPIGLVMFIASVHVRARLDGDGFRVGLFPIWSRRVPLTSIASVEAVTYRPIKDFGGWGLRPAWSRRFRGTTVYSMWGKEGVWVHVKEGRDVLLGTPHTRDWILAFESAGVPVAHGSTDIDF